MSEEHKHDKVRSRNEAFTQRTATRIWSEKPSSDNPYIAESASCHGYDLFELMEKRSFVDVFYLLFRGELPSKADAQLLQTLMIALINPGPRHPATRAAMNVGIGKTDPVHILPIASAVLGGNHLGGGGIESAMRFLRKQQKANPLEFAQQVIAQNLFNPVQQNPQENSQESAHENESPVPGFGQLYGGVDLMASAVVQRLLTLESAGDSLRWGNTFSDALKPQGYGWLMPGVAAAVFADLGFQPRVGGSLFQLLGAPGLVAHGLELANKPITAMPFVSDENYVIER
jgi:citrate synthase